MHSFENQSRSIDVLMLWPRIKCYMTFTNVELYIQQLFCYDLMTKKEKKNENKKLHCILKLDL